MTAELERKREEKTGGTKREGKEKNKKKKVLREHRSELHLYPHRVDAGAACILKHPCDS